MIKAYVERHRLEEITKSLNAIESKWVDVKQTSDRTVLALRSGSRTHEIAGDAHLRQLGIRDHNIDLQNTSNDATKELSK